MDNLDYIINEEEGKVNSYKPANYRNIQYESDQIRFLIHVLEQFKLCFITPNKSSFIIPDLLDTEEPEEVTESIKASSEEIQFVYKYDYYLPKSIMPNIMVDLHSIIDKMWRTGCVVSHDGSTAIITNYKNEIKIIVTGEHKKKREFMSYIRYTIDLTNQVLSIKPTCLIPLLDNDGKIIGHADYERLLARKRKGKDNYLYDEDLPTEKSILISELLECIEESPILNKILKTGKSTNKIVRGTNKNVVKIIKTLNSHYIDLMEKLNKQNNSITKEDIENAIKDINANQTKEIMNEIIPELDALYGEMDSNLKIIYTDLKETDDVKMKLKLSIPLISLLGINFETEFDIKSWAKEMYDKHELTIFKLMGAI